MHIRSRCDYPSQDSVSGAMGIYELRIYALLGRDARCMLHRIRDTNVRLANAEQTTN